MFCIKCGSQLPDDAKFCSECGNVLSGVSDMRKESTKLVPAKCTSCGANLEVDADLKAAICPFCDSAYIVEQAIHNYNITLNGSMNIGSAVINVMQDNADNLLARAEEFRKNQEYDKAIEYYNRVLDIDVNNKKAREGLELIKNKNESTQTAKELFENKEYTKLLELCDSILAAHPEDEEALRYKKVVNECMEEHVYCTVAANKVNLIDGGKGFFKLKKNKLVWIKQEFWSLEYVEKMCMEMEKITQIVPCGYSGNFITITYNGKKCDYEIYGVDRDFFIRLIMDAKNNIYPPIGYSMYEDKAYFVCSPMEIHTVEPFYEGIGKLVLKKGVLSFHADMGQEINYEIGSIKDLSMVIGVCFKVNGNLIWVAPKTKFTDDSDVRKRPVTYAAIENAINGHYYPTTI